MSDRHRDERARSFAGHPLAWTALHHFLTAGLLRELCVAVVHAYGNGATFEDLFDDAIDGAGFQHNWSVVPRSVEGSSLHALQDHIRALVWANDAQVGPFARRPEIEAWILGLRDARRLGAMDLGVSSEDLGRLTFPENDSALLLREAIKAGRLLRDELIERVPVEVADPLAKLPHPLHILALKHLGDLFGDADAWDAAGVFYAAAEVQLEQGLGDAWTDLARPLADITTQSRAQAEWMTEGAKAAAQRLDALIAAPDRARSLGVLNGSHEAVVAKLDAGGRDWGGDLRAATLPAPLLLGSHDPSDAVRIWQAGKHEDSYRRFWAVLRRQVALGSHAESSATKAQYARALLGEGLKPRRKYSPEAFKLGALLLVEAGSKEATETLTFTEDAVAVYVTPDLVNCLAKRAAKHLGARFARHRVLIQLLARWSECLPRDPAPMRDAVLMTLVSITKAFDAAFDSRRNVGGEGLKALVGLADRRPDLRADQASAIADLIVQKLTSDAWWTGTSEALNLARRYLDVFDQAQMRAIVVAALGAIAKESPTGLSPVIIPALEVLTSEQALDALRGDAGVKSTYLSSLMRYGAGARTSAVTLLFAFARLEAEVVEPEDQALLAEMIADLRRAVADHRSSGATDAIRALISAAPLVGPEAVDAAISNLVAILKSGSEGQPSIGFPYAYGPILDLAEAGPTLAETTGLAQDRVDALMAQVEEALVQAWSGIVQKPVRLSGFSIPPAERPDAALGHNWTVATQQFLKQRPGSEPLIAAVRAAAAHPLLSEGVLRGFAASEDPKALAEDELEQIPEEPSEIFYAGLGRRLLIAEKLPDDQRRKLLEALTRRCLKAGPRAQDLAVLLAARPFGDAFDPPMDFSGYVRAVRAEKLGDLLHPVIAAWPDAAIAPPG